jgi:ATP-binding cassette subfamily C (CFTR/MRP) protein 5
LEEGGIKFENLTLKYREELPYVLKDLSFNIKPQERIGIVGRTGSGKSTMLLAILRVIEASSGNIFIDNINIKNLNLFDLRKNLTLISQEPTLFEDTLRANLDLEGNLPDEQLWDILDKIGMKKNFEGK